MTMRECFIWVWNNDSSIDKGSLKSAGVSACLAIVGAIEKALSGGRPIDAIEFNISYAKAGAAIIDWLWKTAVKYFNENVAPSPKLHTNVVSFKGRGGKVTLEEVHTLQSVLYEVLS